jgi:hypothetical protein
MSSVNQLEFVVKLLNETKLKIGLLGGGGSLGRALITALLQDENNRKQLSNKM